MDIRTIERNITDCVNSLCRNFVDLPNKLLTEDDMRMHLGALLLEHFGLPENTEDNDRSISLHSEVRWYGNGRLKYRSDLVIVDVSTLVVRHVGSMRLASKGYGFNIPKAIIELKFRRPNGESNNAFIKSIKADCEKLKAIQSELSPQVSNILCWMIAFDKQCDVSNQLPNGDGVRLIYKSSDSK